MKNLIRGHIYQLKKDHFFFGCLALSFVFLAVTIRLSFSLASALNPVTGIEGLFSTFLSGDTILYIFMLLTANTVAETYRSGVMKNMIGRGIGKKQYYFSIVFAVSAAYVLVMLIGGIIIAVLAAGKFGMGAISYPPQGTAPAENKDPDRQLHRGAAHEQKKALNFDSLKYMAEEVEGSFTFTVLDRRDRLYIVKGDNPLCLLHFPSLGLYLYASTEEILHRAMSQMDLGTYKPCRTPLDCGDILRIDRDGALTRSEFDDYRLFARWRSPLWDRSYRYPWKEAQISVPEESYLDEIKSVASAFGYAPEEIDRLAEMGFSPEELEDYLYCGEL